MLKKVNALILGLAVLLAVGCGKDDPKPQSNPQTPAQRTCKLTKYVLSYPVVGSYYEEHYVYDNAGKVIWINYVNFSSGSTVPAKDSTRNEIIYHPDGRVKETVQTSYSGTYTKRNFYYYNNADLLKEVSDYDRNQGTPSFWNFSYKYEYNAAEQLIKSTSFTFLDTAFKSEMHFSYPTANQVKSMHYSTDSSGVTHLDATVIFQSDGSKSPYIIAGNFMQGGYLQLNNFLPGATPFGKNVISSSYTNYTNGQSGTQFYQNTYNAHGYPIERTTSENGRIFIKEKWYYYCQ
ncbi:hypothetical protein [Adhaeribacter soli]|uniref:DUF4595 domain-containing protein n=1 Tax=Adhaeribacter soli TaxID=2607655 RepID=A0A5N1J0I6_9BACT|nr:hypothetical protein [Adhaeribacter soli]KAA9340215.1 hypothetical protein F0P94_07660 [Adhaeribacter soli]